MKIIELQKSTINLIQKEMDSIPEKYQVKFNSKHEGYAVLLEEVRELEQVVFFGEKEIKKEIRSRNGLATDKFIDSQFRLRMREECVQIAAMAVRFIQELT